MDTNALRTAVASFFAGTSFLTTCKGEAPIQWNPKDLYANNAKSGAAAYVDVVSIRPSDVVALGYIVSDYDLALHGWFESDLSDGAATADYDALADALLTAVLQDRTLGGVVEDVLTAIEFGAEGETPQDPRQRTWTLRFTAQVWNLR